MLNLVFIFLENLDPVFLFDFELWMKKNYLTTLLIILDKTSLFCKGIHEINNEWAENTKKRLSI